MTDHTAALREALAAVNAQLDPSWECNSYHPKLYQVKEVLERALAQPQQPAGWRLVPWTPTPEMLDAAYLPNAMRKDSLTIYRAMVNAAPAHPSQQEDDVRDTTEAQRFVVLKASGSRYAYVNDTLLGKTVKRYDILRGDGWADAERHAERLNRDAAMTAQGQEQGGDRG